MKIKLIVVAVTLMLLLVSLPGASASEDENAPPTAEQVLARLKADHPRLLLDAQGFEQLQSRVEQDPVLRVWCAKLRRDANELLEAKPSEYRIPDGKRLLATSRAVLGRVYTLSLVYRLTGDDRYRDRVWRELETAAAFKDWNPSHFLDTGEMTHAFAIGYDWLYHDWTDEQRRVIREAIVRHGLTPGSKPTLGWRKAHHNWNQVCNGGLTAGALAIADEEPKLAGDILVMAIRSVPLAMSSYAPDGAWGESISYWRYATSYNVMMLAALESALGTDFERSKAEGFDRTGHFPIHLQGPTGLAFNFADMGRPTTTREPALFWLAQRFEQPLYSAYQRQYAEPHALDVIWYPPQGAPDKIPELPRNVYFRDTEAVTLRSAWNDPQATFVAFKAGNNAVNHSHLDIGTFVLDALGERWFVDLGSDNYNFPGYFGSQRWDYYRLRAEGHNTLVLNPDDGPDQDPKAHARVIRFEPDAAEPTVVADLTPAYAAHAERVQRTLTLRDDGGVLVTDEIECKQPSDLWWFLHTGAKITLDAKGAAATLEQQGKRLQVRLLEPKDAQLQVMDAAPLPTSPQPAEQGDNRGVRKLALHLTNAASTRIVIACEPQAAKSE